MNYLLIGRPNVGKSSIFNILTGSKTNIIHEDEGTTRDWHYEFIKNTNSLIYDSPGIQINITKNNNIFLNNNLHKIIKDNIDILFYVVDYKHLFNQIDFFAINKIRKFNKKIFLLVNKFDNFKKDPNSDILKYKINDIIYLSCSHNLGFDTLKKKINYKNELDSLKSKDNYDFSLAIFGKPNVGKSTFLNSVLGYERSHTSPIAGTTSDYVTDYLRFNKKILKIIDTAGINKKSIVKNKSINYYSIKKSFETIPTVNTVIIIIDANEGIDRQDKRIIKLVFQKAQRLIIVFNKIDLIKNLNDFKSETLSNIDNLVRELKNIKIFFISAFNKKHISNILRFLNENIFDNKISISTNSLNKWLQNTTTNSSHPLSKNKKLKFKYAFIYKYNPIKIKIFCNLPRDVKINYKRYLINNFNKKFGITNQKTSIVFTSSNNPYK